ncbi:hypothetical protein COF68_04775 [Bacillus toyonensis]|uniref:hypothetical protein n=1 Tax=Bacillus toyonensis TaxID=155322 RepID=UPI000BFB8052|nr:hypothetical protein [Bacillus toyonensis]PHE64165.1 hypothetical protein COF68_04775 [Bacillus toyonensis]
MNLLTKVKTQKGEELKLGDILSSPMTHDAVVRVGDNGELFVQIIDREDYVFNLESFVSKWSELYVSGSTLTKDRSNLPKGVGTEQEGNYQFSYRISRGSWGDYEFTTLLSDKKYSKQEFIEMYHEILDTTKTTDKEIALLMCEKFGFKLEEHLVEIHGSTGYGRVYESDIDDDKVRVNVDNWN